MKSSTREILSDAGFKDHEDVILAIRRIKLSRVPRILKRLGFASREDLVRSRRMVEGSCPSIQ